MDNLYTITRDEPTSTTIASVFDFTNDLPSGVTVSAKAVAAEDEDGTDVASTLISSSALATPLITVTIITLAIQQNYLVTVTATGSDSLTYKQTLLLRVNIPAVFS